MKGSQKVIEYFNHLISGELGARDQYFIHSRMYDEWGYSKLYERLNHEMEEETQHADALIRRVLLLEGIPNMQVEKINVGSDVVSMLKNDLALELKVREDLKKGIVICEEERDFVSRDILVDQLQDTEEDHAHWLEQQLRLIDEMGLQNYLQSKQ
ncbi:bacterioferritin [Taylorella asinigenitalis]|uniref:Bacterioferritin n=1 Tax=Taylorella asinigenitalis (strain MCE3) TaxID=1008459 RepID=G4QBJ1_TAYAM|nr:bacterioferritin [Taylorella asinigenitalis]AEP36969.1 Bacterioferritin [Taylorella asinigenitalis MCE3]